jgi:hypothetical protein
MQFRLSYLLALCCCETSRNAVCLQAQVQTNEDVCIGETQTIEIETENQAVQFPDDMGFSSTALQDDEHHNLGKRPLLVCFVRIGHSLTHHLFLIMSSEYDGFGSSEKIHG